MPSNRKLSKYRTTWDNGINGGSVTYVSTKIVSWNASKVVTLDSGGYRTVTTKRKMVQASNQFGLGYTVSQRKGDWYVTVFGRSPEGYESAGKEHGAVEFPFYDGITFDPFYIRANKAA